MSMAYIRKQYGVPAKRGARVRLAYREDDVRTGTIVKSRGRYLRVRLDGERDARTFHPTCGVEYIDGDRLGEEVDR